MATFAQSSTSSRKFFQARKRRHSSAGTGVARISLDAATVNWTGLGDDFNWGTRQTGARTRFRASDDVVIDDGGSNAFTVYLTSGSDAVNSLVDDASLSISTASLSIASSSSILGSLP